MIVLHYYNFIIFESNNRTIKLSFVSYISNNVIIFINNKNILYM